MTTLISEWSGTVSGDAFIVGSLAQKPGVGTYGGRGNGTPPGAAENQSRVTPPESRYYPDSVMASTPVNREHRVRTDMVMAFCFVVVSGTIGYGLGNDLGFAGDGAYYFSTILDRSRLFATFAWSRFHANVAAQWPLVLAVRLGITDPGLLRFVFAVGLYFPFALSFLLCAYALRGQDRAALLFPFASILIVSLPAAFILTGESQSMVLACWPILLFLVRPRLSSSDAAILVALLLFLSRTYETAVLAGILFATIGAMRLRSAPMQRRLPFVAAIAAAVLTIAISTYWAVFPAEIANRSGFTSALLRPLFHPAFVCAVIAFMVFALGVRTDARWLLIASIGIGMVSIALPFLGFAASANISFDCRTLTLTVLPILLVAAAWFVHCGICAMAGSSSNPGGRSTTTAGTMRLGLPTAVPDAPARA